MFGCGGWIRLLGRLSGGGGLPESARRGRLGERLAARFLRREKAFRIVTRNWRNGRDELDLVCRDGEVLVFVEVRARAAGARVSGYHSVTRRKRAALLRACRAYMRRLRRPPAHFRFDIVEVRLSKDATGGEVSHFANVPLFGIRDTFGNP